MSRSLQSPIAAVRRQFSEGSNRRIAEIRTLATRVRTENDGAALDELHGALHKLAGSAGIFGFVRTGEIARECELRIAVALRSPIVGLPEGLAQALDRLAFAIREEAHALDAESMCIGTAGSPGRGRACIVPGPTTTSVEALRRELTAAALEPEVVPVEQALVRCSGADVVIVDAAAGGDGYELCRHLSDLPVPPRTRILYIEGNEAFDLLRASPSRVHRMIHRPSDLRAVLQPDPNPGEERLRARILSVEDDEDCGHAIEETLRSVGHTVRVLPKPDLLLAQLRVFRPELLLLDWDLPTMSGHDLARIVRSDARYETTPIVFCTARSERQDRRAASRAGADDFVTKPFTPEELIEAVDTHLRRHRALRKKLDVDALTDLLNRSAALNAIEDLILAPTDPSRVLLVAILDIDHFKRVNDELGHPTGDRVLREMAAHVRAGLRGNEVAGRLGGEELVVALEGTDREELVARIDAMRSTVDIVLRDDGSALSRITFSAGIAFSPEHGTQTAMLLKNADLALYVAKEAGRNRVHVASPEGDSSG